MGTIISVVNNKGGVGKTCITCNLSTALARQGKKVLVVDIDPQCNASSNTLASNNLSRYKKTLYEILDIQSKEINIQEAIYPSAHQERLFCLPNIRATSGLELDFAKMYPDSLNLLSSKLKQHAQSSYDYTLIDTPPNIGIFTAQALCTSQFVIVPIDTSSSDSLDGLQEALNLIASIKMNKNNELKFLRLLLNRIHGKKTICKVISSEIVEKFNQEQRFKATIPENTHLQQAVHLRQNIFKYQRNSRAARAFTQLAKELLNIMIMKKMVDK